MNWTTEEVYFNNSFLRGRSIQEVGLFARVRYSNSWKKYWIPKTIVYWILPIPILYSILKGLLWTHDFQFNFEQFSLLYLKQIMFVNICLICTIFYSCFHANKNKKNNKASLRTFELSWAVSKTRGDSEEWKWPPFIKLTLFTKWLFALTSSS